MKQLIAQKALLGGLLLSLGTSAVAAANPWFVTPYLGADAAVRHMKWASGSGDNLFKTDYPQGNVYGGLQLNDYLGIEAGYELTPTKTSDVALGPNQTTLGQSPPSPNTTVFWTTKTQIKGWHADLMGFCPIFCDEYRVGLVGGIGIARVKLFQSATVDWTIADGFFDDAARKFNTMSASQSVLRLTFGGQHMICEDYGVRALVGWLNTSKFGRIASQQQALNAVNVKNSWQYGLGVFVKF